MADDVSSRRGKPDSDNRREPARTSPKPSLNPIRDARSYSAIKQTGRVRFEASAVTSRCTFPWPTGGRGSARRARKRGRKGHSRKAHRYTQTCIYLENLNDAQRDDVRTTLLAASGFRRGEDSAGIRLSLGREDALLRKEGSSDPLEFRHRVSHTITHGTRHKTRKATDTREPAAPRRATVTRVSYSRDGTHEIAQRDGARRREENKLDKPS